MVPFLPLYFFFSTLIMDKMEAVMRRLLNLEGKPYSKCFACERFYSPREKRDVPRCRGIPTSRMSLPMWCSYLRDAAIFFGLSDEYVSENSDTSLKTVTKVMTLKCDQDLMRDTSLRMEIAVFGPEAHPPCYLYFEEFVKPDAKRIQELELDLLNTKANLQMLNETFKNEIDTVRTEAQAKIDYLRREGEKKDAIISKLLER